ncbi:hypothetical protein EER27_03490 [Lysobacter psychrotolerans]|uniref:Uncharacterized protein n=2 Tax=Montanilutibacter psychrotolerans TaxID=1327343 RepID=A0A3M8T0D3_9GAMM|nr:hypothetical protein EER27_03490 [Lysobacter psychrotolerans]
MDAARAFIRATCYCKDCRAFARFLGQPDVLDASGGTDIVPTAPATVRFTAGSEHVACMSLSPKGLLRWYASCCRTPLANTPRDAKQPYAGLVTACFDAAPQAVDAAFGPRDRIVLNTGSATAPVRSTPLTFVTGGLRILAGVIGARLRRERTSPFFDVSGQPVAAPEVISFEQRAALERDVR